MFTEEDRETAEVLVSAMILLDWLLLDRCSLWFVRMAHAIAGTLEGRHRHHLRQLMLELHTYSPVRELI